MKESNAIISSIRSDIRHYTKVWPNGLLQIITKQMEAGTFFASLLTSKRFPEVASSKPLLLYQLNRIFGLTLGLTDLPTPGAPDL